MSNMNELFKSTGSDGGKRVVSARELYAFLEVMTPFHIWINRITAHTFKEGVDYEIITIKNVRNSKRGPKTKDWLITIDMAKKIGMIQMSEKGDEIRDYFVRCERALEEIREHTLPVSYEEALRALADRVEANKIAVKQLAQAEELARANEPNVAFAEAVTKTTGSILVRKYARDPCSDGIYLDQN